MTDGVFIGLGSNLNNPAQQLLTALEQMRQDSGIELINLSRFYQTPPMGPQHQPDYINAVVEIKTSLTPLALLNYLKRLENLHGRSQDTERWGARTLDLDILLFGDIQLNTKTLSIPHIGLKQRSFVLYPLFDIVKKSPLPIIGRVDTLIQQLNEQPPKVIDPHKQDV